MKNIKIKLDNDIKKILISVSGLFFLLLILIVVKYSKLISNNQVKNPETYVVSESCDKTFKVEAIPTGLVGASGNYLPNVPVDKLSEITIYANGNHAGNDLKMVDIYYTQKKTTPNPTYPETDWTLLKSCNFGAGNGSGYCSKALSNLTVPLKENSQYYFVVNSYTSRGVADRFSWCSGNPAIAPGSSSDLMKLTKCDKVQGLDKYVLNVLPVSGTTPQMNCSDLTLSKSNVVPGEVINISMRTNNVVKKSLYYAIAGAASEPTTNWNFITTLLSDSNSFNFTVLPTLSTGDYEIRVNVFDNNDCNTVCGTTNLTHTTLSGTNRCSNLNGWVRTATGCNNGCSKVFHVGSTTPPTTVISPTGFITSSHASIPANQLNSLIINTNAYHTGNDLRNIKIYYTPYIDGAVATYPQNVWKLLKECPTLSGSNNGFCGQTGIVDAQGSQMTLNPGKYLFVLNVNDISIIPSDKFWCTGNPAPAPGSAGSRAPRCMFNDPSGKKDNVIVEVTSSFTSTPTPAPVASCDVSCVSTHGVCSYRGTDGVCHNGNSGISSTYWPANQNKFCCQYTCSSSSSGQCRLSQTSNPVVFNPASNLGAGYLYNGCKPVASSNYCGVGPNYTCPAEAPLCNQVVGQSLMCTSISKSVSSIRRNQNITFACQSNGVYDVKANFKIMQGTVEKGTTLVTTKDSNNKYYWVYTIPITMTDGSYTVLCQVCDRNNSCTNWSR